MDFVDEVRTRSGRFAGRVKHWESETPTEEATKTSLILPFIQMLGYDIFDPAEVVPEFTADIGIKRGEKVDYAIMQRGKPAHGEVRPGTVPGLPDLCSVRVMPI